MNKIGFKKMNLKDKYETYGGFAWMVIPAVISSVAALVGAVKMFTSDSGSYKTKEGELKWDTHKPLATKIPDTKSVYYSY